MEIVFQSSVRPTPLRMALLSLANCLNEKTRRCDPSLAALAKLVGVSRSQVQKLVRSLIDEGMVSVGANAAGGKPGSTPHYVLHLDRIASWSSTDRTRRAPTHPADAIPTGSADSIPQGTETGIAGARQGLYPRRETGPADRALTGIEPEGTKRRVKKRPLPHTSIPNDFTISVAVRQWAEKRSFGDLDRHLESFVDKCLAQGYTASDWDAKFRNAVRDDWAKLRQVNGAAHQPAGGNDDLFRRGRQ